MNAEGFSRLEAARADAARVRGFGRIGNQERACAALDQCLSTLETVDAIGDAELAPAVAFVRAELDAAVDVAGGR